MENAIEILACARRVESISWGVVRKGRERFLKDIPREEKYSPICFDLTRTLSVYSELPPCPVDEF